MTTKHIPSVTSDNLPRKKIPRLADSEGTKGKFLQKVYSSNRLDSSTESFSIGSLLEKIDRGLINLDTPYQRGLVWDVDRQRTLIDSIYRGYYIPNVLLASSDDSDVYSCLDGKQRLTSILQFVKGEFCLVIDGVKIFFPDLPKADQREFSKKKPFETVVFNNITEEQEVELFRRIQLGVRLERGEMIHAMQHSPLVREITSLIERRSRDVADLCFTKGHLYPYQCLLAMYITLKEPNVRLCKRGEDLDDYARKKGDSVDTEIIQEMDKYVSLIKEARDRLETEKGHRPKGHAMSKILAVSMLLRKHPSLDAADLLLAGERKAGHCGIHREMWEYINSIREELIRREKWPGDLEEQPDQTS